MSYKHHDPSTGLDLSGIISSTPHMETCNFLEYLNAEKKKTR